MAKFIEVTDRGEGRRALINTDKIISIPALIHAIVKCKRVGDNQRKADLNAVIKYLIASGQSHALYSFLDLNIG